nr:HU family DNA-binding protein [Chromobacterium sp. ASV23]
MVRKSLPFIDNSANAAAYIDAVVESLQAALEQDGEVSLRGLGVIRVAKTARGARVVFEPAPVMRYIADKRVRKHEKQD